jgi:hypothetical protein
VLHALVASLELERRARKRQESPFEEGRRWKHRFQQTMERLREAGIKTQPDVEDAWVHYYRRREDWEAQLHRFSLHLGYDWDEITGDRDLLYAADEEMEEPRTQGRQQLESGIRNPE